MENASNIYSAFRAIAQPQFVTVAGSAIRRAGRSYHNSLSFPDATLIIFQG